MIRLFREWRDVCREFRARRQLTNHPLSCWIRAIISIMRAKLVGRKVPLYKVQREDSLMLPLKHVLILTRLESPQGIILHRETIQVHTIDVG